jgi:hypothetical protein
VKAGRRQGAEPEAGRRPKLTEHQRREAIKRRDESVETLAEIGRSYNVSVATISRLTAADEPKVGRVTKQERVLTLLSQPEGASIEEMIQATAAQRAWVPGGHREKEALFSDDIIQAQRRRSPLSHRNAARSLT